MRVVTSVFLGSDVKNAKDFEEKLARIYQSLGTEKDSVLAVSLGIKQPSIAAAKKRQQIPGGWIETLAKKHGLNANWLLFGDGSIYRDKTTPGQYKEEGNLLLDETGAEMQFVPLVEARLSAGHGSLETSAGIQRQYAFRGSFLRRRGNPAHMVLVRVSGDSMAQEIKNDDMVLIDQSQKEVRPGKVYAVGVEDMVYLKQVDARPGQVVLSSVNEKYEPIYIDTLDDSESRIRIIGRAVWTCRELT